MKQSIPYQEILGLSAGISTVLQFLSGILICYKFARKRSTGDSSCLPFVTGFLSCCMWMQYGYLMSDFTISIINFIGTVLFFGYTIFFYKVTSQKSLVVRQFSLTILFLLLTSLYIRMLDDSELMLTQLGLICCATNIIFFAAPLSTLRHVIKTKSADSLPLPVILSVLIVSLQWFLYGMVLGDAFIQIPNFIGCVLSVVQLSLIYIYRTDALKKGYTSVPNVA